MELSKQVASLELSKRPSRGLEWYRKNKKRALAGKRDYERRHPEKAKEWRRTTNRNLRVKVLTHYAGGKPKCACCGEDTYEFLALDHINSNGKEHRRTLGNSNVYNDVKRRGYPPGFQVLCHNCNSAKGFYGRCPHQK